MIEFIDLEKTPDDRKLLVNGSLYRSPKVDIFTIAGPVEIYLSDPEPREAVENTPFSDYPKDDYEFSFGKDYELIPDEAIWLGVSVHNRNSRQSFRFTVEFYTEIWKRLWSMKEYVEEFLRVANNESQSVTRWEMDADEADYTAIYLELPVEDVKTTVLDMLRKHKQGLRTLHELCEASLMSKLRQESVVMHFDFPEEVRVACEQYLLYFVNFLKGLGVEATADLQHSEAGRVLFAVTPADKAEALDKIHTALKTYLQLASSPISGSPDPENEFAIQGLLANVDHLKSQLRLSYLMVRAQETTIQAQQVTIANQQRILSGEVLLDSLKTDAPQPKSEDKEEEVIDGILSLGKYEDKGVTVNLGEVYRRLKRLFKKEA